MQRSVFIFAASLLILTGIGAAAAAPRYEAVTIASTPKAGAGFFRVEIATGKSVQEWGNGTSFSPIVDNAPLPAGEYHLYPTATVNPDSTVSWTLTRMDANSGRTWVAIGGGPVPLVWNDVSEPK